MKIAYVTTRSDLIGGVQVHVRDLAKALAQRGHETVVLTGGQGPYTDSLRAAGIPSVSLQHLAPAINPFRDARALAEIYSALGKLQPDLVSVHSSKAAILGRIAARSLGVPVVFTAHGWNFTPGIARREAVLYRLIERLASPLASQAITVSEFDRNLAVDQKVFSAERVIVVHNGMPDIDPSLRADPGRSPARLVMIARFEPQKDHPTLFQALAELRQEPWQLDLIGDGPLLPQCQAMARELGISDRVRFWGQRMDVAERLAEAQVAVLSTNWEGFPRSILEAMRAGLPVVASAVGGIAESVLDGQNGFVVPRGDAAVLRQRLKQLLVDPTLRTRMGRSGRQRYEEHFTLDHTVEKTLAIYHQTVARHQLRSRANDRGKVPTKAEMTKPCDH